MQLETEELRAAVLNARAAALNAEIQGMTAENQYRITCGHSVVFTEASFIDALNRSGCHENGIVSVAIKGDLG